MEFHAPLRDKSSSPSDPWTIGRPMDYQSIERGRFPVNTIW